MIIKTIIYDAGGFYISAHIWKDTSFAFYRRDVICTHRYGTYCNCRALQAMHDWRWIGSPSWFATDENKAIYEALAALTDLEHWYEGEFAEVDITLALLTT